MQVVTVNGESSLIASFSSWGGEGARRADEEASILTLVAATGRAEYFADSDMFGGHSIDVSINEGKISDASLAG